MREQLNIAALKAGDLVEVVGIVHEVKAISKHPSGYFVHWRKKTGGQRGNSEWFLHAAHAQKVG